MPRALLSTRSRSIEGVLAAVTRQQPPRRALVRAMRSTLAALIDEAARSGAEPREADEAALAEIGRSLDGEGDPEHRAEIFRQLTQQGEADTLAHNLAYARWKRGQGPAPRWGTAASHGSRAAYWALSASEAFPLRLGPLVRNDTFLVEEYLGSLWRAHFHLELRHGNPGGDPGARAVADVRATQAFVDAVNAPEPLPARRPNPTRRPAGRRALRR